ITPFLVPRGGMQPLDIKSLDYFVHVADLRSFTKAASALSIAQSALSHQVRQLEMELAQTLLHRKGGVLRRRMPVGVSSPMRGGSSCRCDARATSSPRQEARSLDMSTLACRQRSRGLSRSH